MAKKIRKDQPAEIPEKEPHPEIQDPDPDEQVLPGEDPEIIPFEDPAEDIPPVEPAPPVEKP